MAVCQRRTMREDSEEGWKRQKNDFLKNSKLEFRFQKARLGPGKWRVETKLSQIRVPHTSQTRVWRWTSSVHCTARSNQSWGYARLHSPVQSPLAIPGSILLLSVLEPEETLHKESSDASQRT
ncbi:hypothetical protein RvY_03917 [Ramazzottius varieornatus]|uniref:Uncharacterized protein n=1 Tax=Ramazzottius varieornatus TaxID=947166 RepID=A0A1D1UVE2_RAMVA|nr:hypothetical protein RvY_03917 [Ramazzottius varieornatus]